MKWARDRQRGKIYSLSKKLNSATLNELVFKKSLTAKFLCYPKMFVVPSIHITKGQQKHCRKILLLNCLCIFSQQEISRCPKKKPIRVLYKDSLLTAWLICNQYTFCIKIGFEGFTASHGPFWKSIFFTFKAVLSSQPLCPCAI